MEKRFEHPNISMTIEQQLESYCHCSNTTERHRSLWYAWQHNKKWLAQMMEWAMPSFPSYSKHDVSHAETVIHNIEMLLGENAIKALSASDCFLLLHVVYIHDIGMCITNDYRKSLMGNPDFLRFLKECSSDLILKKYADVLLAECDELHRMYSVSEHDPRNDGDKKKVLQIKLKVYYAIIYLVAEFSRSRHGQESRKVLNEWIGDDSKLGAGFSTSGIPSRFFYTIGACACVHTSYDFQDIMALPKRDGGYAKDYMHPRFAAVLLQLGDALDLDNDRFHPLMKEFNDQIPEVSEVHFGKHKAIRRLRISPSKITIHADCEKSDELRLVQQEYENIRDILLNATFHWSAICPENISQALPELEPLVLKLNGEGISAELAKTKFTINQTKAFNLLQGSNIYKEDRFVFLREVFQNAIDATKLQCWQEIQGSCWRERKKGKSAWEQFLHPDAYPIEIEFHLAVKEKYSRKYQVLDTIYDYRKYQEKTEGIKLENLEFGTVIKVRDYGTGISERDIKWISNVGSGNKLQDIIYKNMPKWLEPTAEFGVGLQSIFLVADSFKAYTHVRNGECYDIVFNNAGENGSGTINVVPVSDADQKEDRTFGTCFEIFVSEERVRESVQARKAADDPFSHDEKDDSVRLDRIRGNIVKMISYLDEIICEKLFPVTVTIFDYLDKRKYYLGQLKGQAGRNLYIILEWNGKVETLLGEEQENEVTWIYGKNETKKKFQTAKNCKYLFDMEKGCLKIADKDNNIYACVSPERIINERNYYHDSEKRPKYLATRIYYKGVYVTKSELDQELELDLDMDLLEYIDIKGSLDRKYLALNRSEFTEEGKAYIRDELYLQVLDYIHEAINDYTDSGKIKELEEWLKEVNKKKGQFGPNEDNDIFRRYLFLAGIVAFRYTKSHNTYLTHVEEEKQWERNKSWNEILKLLSEYIQYEVKNNRLKTAHWSHSTFFQLNVYKIEGDSLSHGMTRENLADIVNTNNKYIIISCRDRVYRQWSEVLVKLVDGDKIKEKVMELKTQSNPEKQNELTSQIEAYFERIGDAVRNMGDSLFTDRRNSVYNSEREILLWILENIPSLAIYSNRDQTLRINVLDCEQTDSVYISRQLKLAIYHRMADLYRKEGVQRFSTVAHTSFCQLGIDGNYPGVRFLKRGKFGKAGRRHVIIPLTGESMGALEQWLDQCGYSHVLTLYETISEYCRVIGVYLNQNEMHETSCLEKIDKTEEERIMHIITQLRKQGNGTEDGGETSHTVWTLNNPRASISEYLKHQVSSKPAPIPAENFNALNEWLEEELKNNTLWHTAGEICEAILLHTLNVQAGGDVSSSELSGCEWQKKLEDSWMALTTTEEWVIRDEYLRVENLYWDQKIKDTVLKYFAFPIPDESENNEEARKKRETALQAKAKLIQAVKERHWIKSLNETQIKAIYTELVKDMMDIFLLSVKTRRDNLASEFGIEKLFS